MRVFKVASGSDLVKLTAWVVTRQRWRQYMTDVSLRPFLLVLILVGLPGKVLADNCAAMEASGPQWFSAELDRAQTTFNASDSAGAYEQLRQAATGLPRSVDVSLDARCVGPALWLRYYKLRRSITQPLGQAAEKAGRLESSQGALDWYVTGDNQGGARRVTPLLTPTTEGTTWVIARLRSEVQGLDHAVTAGFQLLPEERAALTFWQHGLEGTIRYAQSKVTEVLQAETRLLTRAATDEELQIEQTQQGLHSMAAGFFGDESLAPDMEAQHESNRANASLTMLNSARDWGSAVSVEDAAEVNERAVQRGDALLARVGETTLGLKSRESLLEAAENYFEFAGNRERQQAAQRALAAIAPAVETERAQRNAKIDKKADELRESSARMRDSVIKTEEQKQSFKDEAEALESELGF
jgi:hypothetical protein